MVLVGFCVFWDLERVCFTTCIYFILFYYVLPNVCDCFFFFEKILSSLAELINNIYRYKLSL